MANKSKLGRGLDILLGQSIESPVQARSGDLLIQMKLDQLQRGQFQPRSKFNESKLDELTQSIASHGVIQPLVVRQISPNQFEIIAGERRWRAAKQAGLNEVPVVVRDIDDQVALAIALIENIQRDSLTPIEEAKALSRLIQDFKMTHEEVSQVIGRSRSAVSNLLRLLKLSDAVKVLLENGEIEMGHARTLLPLPKDLQIKLAQEVAIRELSVRQTEVLVRQALNPNPKNINKISPQWLEMTESLSKRLNSKAEIKPGKGDSGKIIIHFDSKESLTDIFKKISNKRALLIKTTDS
jgi:ParB family chromosome partitioning protein